MVNVLVRWNCQVSLEVNPRFSSKSPVLMRWYVVVTDRETLDFVVTVLDRGMLKPTRWLQAGSLSLSSTTNFNFLDSHFV